MERGPPDFRAKVEFLKESEGGRVSLPRQGYRPDLTYPEDLNKRKVYMIWPRFLDGELNELKDGSSISNNALANFWIADQELKEKVHRGRIQIGTELCMCEGPRKVASVVVTKLLEGLR